MDYDLEAQADAAEDLAPIEEGGSGQVVTLTTPGEGEYDKATLTNAPGGPVAEEGSGIELAYSEHVIDGQRILAGDLKFMLSPLQTNGQPVTKPIPDKTVLTKEVDGSEWMVKKVDPFGPAGRPILFNLQLRQVSDGADD